jgi:hypothetical protein
MAFNKSLLFLMFFGALIWAICTSWTPKIVSHSVKGKVNPLHGNVINAKIKYTQKKGNVSVDDMRELDVLADGTFSGTINIEPNGIVYFRVIKEGYTSAYKALRLDAEGENDIGQINISSLHEELSILQISNEEHFPKINLFKDDCLRKLDYKVSVKDIFFEDLQPIPDDASCEHPYYEAKLSAKIIMDGVPARKKYFGLSRESSGRMVITHPQPAGNAPASSGSMMAID